MRKAIKKPSYPVYNEWGELVANFRHEHLALKAVIQNRLWKLGKKR
jgi:hypothetical protein